MINDQEAIAQRHSKGQALLKQLSYEPQKRTTVPEMMVRSFLYYKSVD